MASSKLDVYNPKYSDIRMIYQSDGEGHPQKRKKKLVRKITKRSLHWSIILERETKALKFILGSITALVEMEDKHGNTFTMSWRTNGKTSTFDPKLNTVLTHKKMKGLGDFKPLSEN